MIITGMAHFEVLSGRNLLNGITRTDQRCRLILAMFMLYGHVKRSRTINVWHQPQSVEMVSMRSTPTTATNRNCMKMYTAS